jgi:hypothetical protein
VLLAPLGSWSTTWRWSTDSVDAEDLALRPQLAAG